MSTADWTWTLMSVNLVINLVVLFVLASRAKRMWPLWTQKMHDLFYALSGWCVLNFLRTIKNLSLHRAPTEWDLSIVILTTLMLMFTLRGLRKKGEYIK